MQSFICFKLDALFRRYSPFCNLSLRFVHNTVFSGTKTERRNEQKVKSTVPQVSNKFDLFSLYRHFIRALAIIRDFSTSGFYTLAITGFAQTLPHLPFLRKDLSPTGCNISWLANSAAQRQVTRVTKRFTTKQQPYSHHMFKGFRYSFLGDHT